MSYAAYPPDFTAPVWQDDPYAARLETRFEVRKLRGLGDLLQRTFQLYRECFGLMIPVTLILVIPFDVVIAVLDTFSSGEDALSLLSGLTSMLQAVATSFATPAIIYAMLIHLRERRRAGLREAMIWGGMAGWRTLGYWIVRGLIVLLGMVLLIVPGLIFMVWFYLTDVVVAAEGRNHPGVLNRSRELVRGNGWHVLASIVVLSLIMLGVGIVAGVLMDIIPELGQFDDTILMGYLIVVNTLFNSALSLLVWLYTAVAVVAYMDGVGSHLRECSACGYNLTGNVSGRCPECGKPIPPQVQALINMPQAAGPSSL
ncbi:MAG: hypothetical protein IT445_09235 [Phycisphaeraceae bacterium]|nr:hypothetical protein [Phycisphaeraceae bacterium]